MAHVANVIDSAGVVVVLLRVNEASIPCVHACDQLHCTTHRRCCGHHHLESTARDERCSPLRLGEHASNPVARDSRVAIYDAVPTATFTSEGGHESNKDAHHLHPRNLHS